MLTNANLLLLTNAPLFLTNANLLLPTNAPLSGRARAHRDCLSYAHVMDGNPETRFSF